MGQGYTRNDTGNNIADGNVINASDLDGEFDAVQAAFNGSTGHSHDGTTGEGPQIDTAGIADDAVTGAKIDETTTVTAASFVGPLTGNVTGNVTGDVSGNAGTATAWETGRTVTLSGAVTGSATGVDGTGNVSITTTATSDPTITLAGDLTGSVTLTNLGDGTLTAAVVDDSHNHVISNVDGLQTALDAKADDTTTISAGTGLTGGGSLASNRTISIATGGVDTTQLAADAVDGTKIADNSINSEHYVDGSIDRVHLAADIIDGTKIADDVINSEHYVAGSIDNEHLANDSVNAAKIAANAVGASELNVTGNGTDGQALVSDGDGSMTWETIAVDVYDTASSSTGYFDLPAGTTAQRPGTPANGMVRYNSTTNEAEVYAAGEWVGFYTNPNEYTAEYLIVAGGGSGGSGTPGWGGGGGAGGYLAGTQTVLAGTTYTVTVGAGGAGGTSGTSPGNNGNDSSALSLTAVGGGKGAETQTGVPGEQSTGSPGGSGGGSGQNQTNVGGGTTGQGNPGGTGTGGAGGGGGGAGETGQNAATNIGGDGGDGLQNDITGTNTYYAGGGGGPAFTTPGAGGQGGGGAGGNGSGEPGSGVAGTANTGGAGGGDDERVNGTGPNGGSGVVILRVPTAKYSGTTTGSPTVTTDGDFKVIKFTASGSYTA